MGCEEWKPYILCALSNICLAGFNIVSKVSLQKGMSRYVLVVYGYAIGTLATAFLVLLFERNHKGKMSVAILRDIFFLGLLGAVLGRTLYYAGMEYTSPALASAMGNLIPSFTFVLALVCRMEKLEIRKLSSLAKIGGTLMAIAGAALMTIYKGMVVISFHNRRNPHEPAAATSSKSFLDWEWIKGSLMLATSALSLAAFYILQSTTLKKYPAPLTLTMLMCLSGTLSAVAMTLILDHKASSWRLSWDISLLAPIYSGILIFGVTTFIQILVLQTKDPVFVTAFRPLATLLVTLMGIVILRDSLYLGSIMGAIMIILALYSTLWGKTKEEQGIKRPAESTNVEQALNIASKVSLQKGMSQYVLDVYGYAIGTLTTALFVVLFERNHKGKMSTAVLRDIFSLGLLGAVLGQTLYHAGMEYTSPAFALPMCNLIPSFTFVLALVSRMEKLELGKVSSQAKIGGTLMAVVCATLMTIYKEL